MIILRHLQGILLALLLGACSTPLQPRAEQSASSDSHGSAPLDACSLLAAVDLSALVDGPVEQIIEKSFETEIQDVAYTVTQCDYSTPQANIEAAEDPVAAVRDAAYVSLLVRLPAELDAATIPDEPLAAFREEAASFGLDPDALQLEALSDFDSPAIWYDNLNQVVLFAEGGAMLLISVKGGAQDSRTLGTRLARQILDLLPR